MPALRGIGIIHQTSISPAGGAVEVLSGENGNDA